MYVYAGADAIRVRGKRQCVGNQIDTVPRMVQEMSSICTDLTWTLLNGSD